MAHMKPVRQPTCGQCPTDAHYDVFDRFGKWVGRYCARHAEDTVEAMNQYEQRLAKAATSSEVSDLER